MIVFVSELDSRLRGNDDNFESACTFCIKNYFLKAQWIKQARRVGTAHQKGYIIFIGGRCPPYRLQTPSRNVAREICV